MTDTIKFELKLQTKTFKSQGQQQFASGGSIKGEFEVAKVKLNKNGKFTISLINVSVPKVVGPHD